MRFGLTTMTAVLAVLAGCTTAAPTTDTPPTSAAGWDDTHVALVVDAARKARQQGDLATAERLCYSTFVAVDRAALSSYDAYVALLNAEHRAEEAPVRAHADRLREVKQQQARGGQPGSMYLGFSPVEDLDAYAALLQSLQRPEDAQRTRSLARAYQQVQQAHYVRTRLLHDQKDARGVC